MCPLSLQHGVDTAGDPQARKIALNTASVRERPTRGVPPKLGKGALCGGLKGPQCRKKLACYGKLNWFVILKKNTNIPGCV